MGVTAVLWRPTANCYFTVACMYSYSYVSSYAYIHAYMHAYIHAYIHTYIHACIYTYIYTCIHTYMHIYIHACMHAYIHTYIHTYTYACMHAYVRTYVPKCHTSPSPPDLYLKTPSDLPNLQYRVPQYIITDSDYCNNCNQVHWKVPPCNCGETYLIHFKHEYNVNNNVTN